MSYGSVRPRRSKLDCSPRSAPDGHSAAGLLENLEQRLLLTTVSMALSATEITEAGGVPAVFTVSRDNTVGDLTVNYRVGGSEPSSKIAETLSGTLVIPAGASSANITATPINDGIAGYHNTLTIALLDPDGNGYSLGTVSQGTVRISESNSVLGTYLTVGPGKTYATPWAAISAASGGVFIDVWPAASGQYTMNPADSNLGKIRASNVTIRGMGAGRVKVFSDPATHVANDQGIFVQKSGYTGLTMENLDVEGARGNSWNCAALRAESGSWTVRNCLFANNEDGILCSGASNTQLLVEYSEFYHNGQGDPGQTHNLYVAGGTLTFRYNLSHDSYIGHLLKSRCLTNYILYNRFQGEANESYEVSTPDAGKTYIIGNVIHQAPDTDNSGIIDYASEGSARAGDYLYIVGNTVVNDLGGGTFIQATNIPSGFNVTIKDNILAGPGTSWSLGGGVVPTTAGNVINSSIAALNFVNAAAYDYHLLSTSPAINAGVAPGNSSDGYSLVPTQEYVKDNGARSRYSDAVLDAGGYEGLVVAFAQASSNGSESVTAVTLPVALSYSSASTVTVNYAVTGGTATGGGTDYTLAAGALTFTAGQTGKNISFTVVDDAVYEGDETIIVTLSSPSNATLGGTTVHTYTITENDAPPMPEMDVFGNGVEIACGDNLPDAADGTSMGQQSVYSGAISRTFTIWNNGTAPLTLLGNPDRVVLGGAHAGDFRVTQQPAGTVLIGGSSTFTVAFDPTAVGVRTAIVSIANDEGEENPYTFAIEGTGTGFGGDANVDAKVDTVDLAILALNYNTNGGATWDIGDFNNDGNVNVLDLAILALNYNLSPPSPPIAPAAMAPLAGDGQSSIALTGQDKLPHLVVEAGVEAGLPARGQFGGLADGQPGGRVLGGRGGGDRAQVLSGGGELGLGEGLAGALQGVGIAPVGGLEERLALVGRQRFQLHEQEAVQGVAQRGRLGAGLDQDLIAAADVLWFDQFQPLQ